MSKCNVKKVSGCKFTSRDYPFLDKLFLYSMDVNVHVGDYPTLHLDIN